MAFDVLALLDRLSIEQVAFCGVELGGMVGIWLAAHAPERLSSLVLSSASAHYDDYSPWNERAWSVRFAGTDGIAAEVVAGWFSPEWAAHPEAVEHAIQMVTKTTEDGSPNAVLPSLAGTHASCSAGS